MSIVGGLSGYVNKTDSIVSSTQKWNITYSGEPAAYVASSTKKGTVRVAGTKDWSGQYTALGATPAIKFGETFKFEGSLDGTNGYTGDAICDSCEITWDVDAGILTHTVSFSANGALTKGAVAGVADTTVPPVDLTSIITEMLKQGDPGAGYTDVPDIRTMTLTLNAANVSYVSSTTAGQTKRSEGPRDVELSYSLYEGDPANLFDPGTVKQLRLFVNTTQYWELRYMRFGEIGGVESDQSTGEIIGATQICKMEGFTDIAGTMTEGAVIDPGGTTWWP